MLIEPYIEKEYPKTNLYNGINAIEEELMVHRFFIVTGKENDYKGMLTIPDVFSRKKKLVVDCLTPKPSISPDSSIDQAMILMSATHLPALPVVDDDKHFYGIISQTKILEILKNFQKKQVQAYEQRIQISERVKTEFIQSISHEIRTPLNAIQGLSEVLIYTDITEQDKENYAGLLHAKTDELLNVVDSLLNLSRLKAGDFSISVSENNDPVILGDELMNKALKIRESYNKEHLVLSHSLNFPETFQLNTSLPYLQQIMVHLINNAIKFTNNGEVEFGSYTKTDNTIVFYVKDTGPGIPKEKQDVIFHAFEKAWPADNHIYPGLGVGLTIASKIVESVGGQLWFKTDNTGTCFYFCLPEFN